MGGVSVSLGEIDVGVLCVLILVQCLLCRFLSWAQRMSAKEMEGALAKSEVDYTPDLTDLSIKEINERLKHQPKDVTLAFKRKRRTLKNRQ